MWAFWDPFFLCIHFVIFLWEWDKWPSPRNSGSLSLPSLHSLLMWLHSIFDLSWSSFFFVYSSFRYYPYHCLWFIPFASPPYSFLTLTYSRFDISPASLLRISLSVDLLHPVIDIIFTLGTFRSMAHELFYTCCNLYMRAWAFDHWVFGLSFLSFLLTYHPSLRYVPCLKTTLAMGLMSCSTTPTWPSVWDLVDI